MEISSRIEKIRQCRLQMILHSQAYYKYNFTIIDDKQFDKWAEELKTLQNTHPSESQEVEFHEQFLKWDGTTGFHLIEIEVKRNVNRLYYLLKHQVKTGQLTAEQKDFIDCVDRGIY